MKTPKTNVFQTLLKLNKTKNVLLEIRRGYPSTDSEFDDTIELLDAMMHGPDPLQEVLEKQGLAHLDLQEVIDHINHRILHFYNLGKP